jgi:hypothetical protein
VPAYHRKRWILVLVAGVLAAGLVAGAFVDRSWHGQQTTDHLVTEAQRLQHKTNTIVYEACLSDTDAERKANMVVQQLRRVILSQAVIASRLGYHALALRDTRIASQLPVFPPLPPCGDRP